MRVHNRPLYDFLIDGGISQASVLDPLLAEAEKARTSLADLLVERKVLPLHTVRMAQAHIMGIPFVDLSHGTINHDVLQIIPEPIAKRYNIIAFEKTGAQLHVAMLNPEDLQAIDFIRKRTGLKITPCLTSEESIRDALRQYEKSLSAEFGDILQPVADDVAAQQDGGGEDLAKMAQDIPVVRVVDTLLKHAILQSASDIHIEPDEKEIRVRYRIDGVLHDAMSLPRQVLAGIVARIKVLSNLKLDEHRVPQDGRFKIETDNYKISFRVSILPVFDGEKIVMRLLDESSKGLTLEKMGLRGDALEAVHRAAKRPNGMLLVTGPTGSGKTTTLYTLMDILNTPGVNISTVEDPVEYRMTRINQTQINPKVGMTFAAGLRALLRQDPDIIMVGEIRDEETLEIAVHAAMTGHLVLSTLHTNSAAGAIPRMIDMGVEPFLIASTVKVIAAQRLVRKVCADCRMETTLSAQDRATLSAIVAVDDIVALLIKRGDLPKDFSLDHAVVYKPKGCATCSNEGYRGRIGIYEVLEVTEAIQKLISSRATAEEIEQSARSGGMLRMIDDGIYKVLTGATTIDEIMRVTQE